MTDNVFDCSATDVWSFGVVLWEVWHGGTLPYDKMSERKLVSAVAQGYRLNMGVTCLLSVYRYKCRAPPLSQC
jgi:hypothetical protein